MPRYTGNVEDLPHLSEIVAGYDSSENLPGYLRISLLTACNGNCIFCHGEGHEYNEDVIIDEATMKRAILASLRLGKRKFKFTGGEPLLHPDVEDFVAFIKANEPDTNVGIVTNGTYLAERAKGLVGAGLDKVSISIHSMDEDVHKAITGTLYLNDVTTGVDALHNNGFRNISANMVITHDNMGDIADVAEYCMVNGFPLKVLDVLHSEGDGAYPAWDEIYFMVSNLLAAEPKFKGTVIAKAKDYHIKCVECESRSMCGEAEYLRMSPESVLSPCMFREDLKVPLLDTDDSDVIERKVALGLRRIQRDDM